MAFVLRRPGGGRGNKQDDHITPSSLPPWMPRTRRASYALTLAMVALDALSTDQSSRALGCAQGARYGCPKAAASSLEQIVCSKAGSFTRPLKMVPFSYRYSLCESSIVHGRWTSQSARPNTTLVRSTAPVYTPYYHTTHSTRTMKSALFALVVAPQLAFAQAPSDQEWCASLSTCSPLLSTSRWLSPAMHARGRTGPRRHGCLPCRRPRSSLPPLVRRSASDVDGDGAVSRRLLLLFMGRALRRSSRADTS